MLNVPHANEFRRIRSFLPEKREKKNIDYNKKLMKLIPGAKKVGFLNDFPESGVEWHNFLPFFMQFLAFINNESEIERDKALKKDTSFCTQRQIRTTMCEMKYFVLSKWIKKMVHYQNQGIHGEGDFFCQWNGRQGHVHGINELA